MRRLKVSILSTVGLMVVFSVLTAPVWAADRNLILTEGTAEVMGQNDSAAVFLSVVTEGRELESVSADNAAKTEQALKSIDDLGIEKLKVKTANFRVDPQSDYKTRPVRIVGYKVYNAIQLTLESFEPGDLSRHVSTLIGTALQNGANSVESLQFYIKNRASLEKEALTAATRQAIERANILAEAAGVKLKRIASITTQPNQPMPVRMMDRGIAMAAEAAAPPPIESGESVVRAQVQIAYEME